MKLSEFSLRGGVGEGVQSIEFFWVEWLFGGNRILESDYSHPWSYHTNSEVTRSYVLWVTGKVSK